MSSGDNSTNSLNLQRLKGRPAGKILGSRAVTLVEVIFGVLVLGVLVSLFAGQLGRARQTGREALCVFRVRALGTAIAGYSLESRGFFPAVCSDNPADLTSLSARREYCRQPYTVFEKRPLLGIVPAAPTRRGLDCPGMSREAREMFPFLSAYRVSASVFIDPQYLNADGPGGYLGARVQRADDVRFPSAKALVFEQYSWHSVVNRPLETLDIAKITPSDRSCSSSTSFADGSSEMLAPARVLSAGVLSPWSGGPLALTVDGVRGRDR